MFSNQASDIDDFSQYCQTIFKLRSKYSNYLKNTRYTAEASFADDLTIPPSFNLQVIQIHQIDEIVLTPTRTRRYNYSCKNTYCPDTQNSAFQMMSESGKTPKRRGRPPSPEGTSRNNRVVTFVTDNDLEKINALAKTSNYPLSKMVYCLLREALNEPGNSKKTAIQQTAITGVNCHENQHTIQSQKALES